MGHSIFVLGRSSHRIHPANSQDDADVVGPVVGHDWYWPTSLVGTNGVLPGILSHGSVILGAPRLFMVTSMFYILQALAPTATTDKLSKKASRFLGISWPDELLVVSCDSLPLRSDHGLMSLHRRCPVRRSRLLFFLTFSTYSIRLLKSNPRLPRQIALQVRGAQKSR